MERQPVSSSTIVSIGYDHTTAVLEVEFLKTGVYQFFNVPAATFESLMTSSSHGKFFNANIKGHFAYERL